MSPSSVNMRDAGLALISRINRWMIAGAIGLTGVISVAAANAFQGRTVSSSSSSASTPAQQSPPPQSSASSNDGGATSTDSGSSLQQPAQAPAPAPAAPSAPVVSGGS